MNKRIVLTLSFFIQILQIFCLHADTFTIRPAEQKDMPACIELAKHVCDTTYRPFLSINGVYDNNVVDEYIRKIDATFFDDFGGRKIGQLFVAENEHKHVVACMKVDPFFATQKNSEVWKEFIAIKVQELVRDTLEDDINWFIKHCDGFGVYVSRLYVDQNWRGKGVGKFFLKSIKSLYPGTKKIYLNTYAGNKPAFDFYKHLGFDELDHLFVGQFYETVFFSIDINLLT